MIADGRLVPFPKARDRHLSLEHMRNRWFVAQSHLEPVLMQTDRQ
jgi:hypothetical protein